MYSEGMKFILLLFLSASFVHAEDDFFQSGFLGISGEELEAMADEVRGLAAEAQFAVPAGGVGIIPRYDDACIFGAVARIFNLDDWKEYARPAILCASTMTEQDRVLYGEAMARQTLTDNGGPIQNLYDQTLNLIFLDDRPESYLGARSIDDVIAHEFTHFYQLNHPQVPYGNGDSDGSPEVVANQVQSLFRDAFVTGGDDACRPPR